MSHETTAFKIRNANFPLFVLQVLTDDFDDLKRQLHAHVAQAPDFLAGAPVALGLTAIAESNAIPDFSDLIAVMGEYGLYVAGIVGGSPAQRTAAVAAGIGLFPERLARARQEPREAPPPPPEPVAEPVAEVPAPKPQPAPLRPSLIIDKPVRAGQRIHAEGADLVVLAIVNAGAELIADGDIHVYAPLRGRALAGARGNKEARIYVQAMEAELVSIAGLYQVFEEGVPPDIHGKPAQVYLDGERVELRALAPMR